MRSPLSALAATGLFLLLAVLGSGTLTRSSTVFAAGTSLSFNPVADAYVYESMPNTNYGNATTLRVDGSPIMRSYLRFNGKVSAGA